MIHDTAVQRLIAQEQQRQKEQISLIASENYASEDVLAAAGSVLTNKYAEGYPGKRYYAGCTVVDQVEQLAIDRCKTLFGVEHVNVQPHAGSQANMAAYLALLNPGDTIMGMSLASGGHLTHGHQVNFSGKIFKAVQYGVDRQTEQFDFEEIAALAQQHRPKLIIAGASAYSRTIDFAAFKKIADSVGAYFLADIAHIAGLIAAGVHPSPVGLADVITSTTHKTLRGPRGGLIMSMQKSGEIIDKTIIPGMQGGPLMHVIAAKAVAFFEAQQPDFVAYQKRVIANAQAMAQEFAQRGYRIVAGGTDNHLFVVDLRAHGITGLQAERTLERIGICVSRSCIPFDPEKPWITSGMRLGTPAITTRGMEIDACKALVDIISQALEGHADDARLTKLAQQIRALAHTYPIKS